MVAMVKARSRDGVFLERIRPMRPSLTSGSLGLVALNRNVSGPPMCLQHPEGCYEEESERDREGMPSDQQYRHNLLNKKSCVIIMYDTGLFIVALHGCRVFIAFFHEGVLEGVDQCCVG